MRRNKLPLYVSCVEYRPSMLSKDHDARVLANDKTVVELAPYLMNDQNILVFGNTGMDLPTGLRHRIKLTLHNQPPLIIQAQKALHGGNLDRAVELLNGCFADGIDQTDPRFFSVLWSCATAARRKNDAETAIDFMKRALTTYSALARENHYVELARLILDQGVPDAETHAAAILQRGIERLGLSSGAPNNPKGSPLLTLHAELEHSPRSPITGVLHLKESSTNQLDVIARTVNAWARKTLKK